VIIRSLLIVDIVTDSSAEEMDMEEMDTEEMDTEEVEEEVIPELLNLNDDEKDEAVSFGTLTIFLCPPSYKGGHIALLLSVGPFSFRSFSSH
jgi:hypothetical protein